ncbi:GNAT family N-acetyltransferase [Pseudoalteromonas luteoviolacea]|uniref:N-acetyltransferase domain-containing protein n=1 Tax=Pseudoalteromonas luteoviolacea S4054 TaxID=1129367 RepID=A0A0F6AEK5_9GAMM|nr:N-acetyltransferase [Pseudoalteromonas luteoviolacea]AOT08310.1 histone acetyltransferase [Pseudoalteromonas luteoviolacea]AOT13226.1 histone acetyltransferase [Pseudoalteromonas luteoviolacea]AOT18139.1 histone acetyltransferase [Pseudoalteromonas luteoviolacea]KKE84246.1 hypothetical protein N479_10125 [Pseudoalteromonas luteoviolacea S4054]KZN76149.1 hypothetical protein N481_07290 [Pseudoalteromonas luteoviolacea S4047-1]
MKFTLRRTQEEDLDYLLELRRLTMDQYLLQDGVDISDKEHLFRIKFNFEDAKIILVNGKKAGLFKASYILKSKQWYIYQVQIHPDFQGNGIGGRLIQDMCNMAAKEGSEVGLSVLKSNPAKALYDRLGFSVIDSNCSEYEMLYKSKLRTPVST